LIQGSRRACAGFPVQARLLKSEQNHSIFPEVLRVPLYEYQCKKCKHKFEKIQKFSDPPVRKCPECGSPVEQLLHAPAVQFKGTGWYVTDYAGKKEASSDVKHGKSDDSSDAKETKPAAKDKDKEHKPKKAESKKSKE
jgi:putative FmdB family regulatory protein